MRCGKAGALRGCASLQHAEQRCIAHHPCAAAQIPTARYIPGSQDKSQHISKYLQIVSNSLCHIGLFLHTVALCNRATSHSAMCQQCRQQIQTNPHSFTLSWGSRSQSNIRFVHWKMCAIHFQKIKLTLLPSHTQPPNSTTERWFLSSEQVHCDVFSSLHKLYSS